MRHLQASELLGSEGQMIFVNSKQIGHAALLEAA
jgi:hypothetical protein